MRTICNPGRRLEVEGRFDFRERGRWIEDHGMYEKPGIVVDVESEREVTLAGLLREFLYDPTDARTGFVRITIEPAPF